MKTARRLTLSPTLSLALSLGLALLLCDTARAHGAAAHAEPDAVKRVQQVFGIAGRAKAVNRTVLLTMSDDMRFTPDRIEVREGETLRLKVRNKGRILHEMVLGTPAELQAHAAMMAKFPDMEHQEAHMTHVPAGKEGEIIWLFNRAGEFDFACLINGHFQAGMRGRLIVLPRPAKPGGSK